MARIKDQDIPPEFADFYKRALGDTRSVKYPGAKHPGLLDAVCSKYPPTLEPPHVPTEEQLAERDFFLASVACFNATPLNERFAYYRLSLESGLFYYDFYHSENIPRLINGESCIDISRPLASAYLGEEPLCPAHIAVQFHGEGDLTLHFDATLDPAVYFRCTEDEWYEALILFQGYYDTDEEPPLWKVNWTHAFTPTERTRYTEDFILPDPGFELRRVNLDRFSLTDSQAVTWKFALDIEPDFYDYDNWSEIPGWPPP
jgi:hypothetical protein